MLSDKLLEEWQRGEIKEIQGDVIEIISNEEKYLLDKSGERQKRICGDVRRDGSGRICKSDAGKYTEHSGFGPCKKHERNIDGQKKMWNRELKKKKAKGDFISYIRAMEKVSDEEVEDLTDSCRLIKASIAKYVNENHEIWTTENSFALMSMLENLRRTTETSYKMRKGIFLTEKLADAFFSQLVSIAESMFGKERAQQFFITIIQETQIPKEALVSDKMTQSKMKEIKEAESFTAKSEEWRDKDEE